MKHLSALTGLVSMLLLSAPVNAQEGMNIDQDGNVGIGLTDPVTPLHIFRNDATQEFLLLHSDAGGAPQDRAMMDLVNNGGIRFEFTNDSLSTAWRFQAATGNQDKFEVTKVGTGNIELSVDASGNMTLLGTLSQGSDRAAKKDVEQVNGLSVLERLDALPIAEWTYITDTTDARHVGPMAQDFHASFGLGANDTTIAPGDLAGVGLAAVKALHDQLRSKQAEVDELRLELRDNRAQTEDLAARLAALEAMVRAAGLQPQSAAQHASR